jgi:hypothetical protein
MAAATRKSRNRLRFRDCGAQNAGVLPARSGKRGYWELRIAGGPDPERPGKYLELTKTFGPCSERDAVKERADWQRKHEMQSGDADARAITFGELLDASIEAVEQSGRATKTLQGYQRNIDNWLKPDLDSRPLARQQQQQQQYRVPQLTPVVPNPLAPRNSAASR